MLLCRQAGDELVSSYVRMGSTSRVANSSSPLLLGFAFDRRCARMIPALNDSARVCMPRPESSGGAPPPLVANGRGLDGIALARHGQK